MDFNFDEFDESEVMFSDYSSDQSVESNEGENGSNMRLKRRKSVKKKPRISSSMPVNIPMINTFRYDFDEANFEAFNADDHSEDEMKLPPHLIVERRVNEEVARSFSPLKGKNLCEVRNSILRMTGFLER